MIPFPSIILFICQLYDGNLFLFIEAYISKKTNIKKKVTNKIIIKLITFLKNSINEWRNRCSFGHYNKNTYR